MKKTYWFVYYEACFTNKQKEMITVKGNSAFEFVSETFLPQVVIEVIKKTIQDHSQYKISKDFPFEVFVKSFNEIGESGFDGFINSKLSDVENISFCVNGAEFGKKNTLIKTQ